jgi:hypothetical protein
MNKIEQKGTIKIFSFIAKKLSILGKKNSKKIPLFWVLILVLVAFFLKLVFYTKYLLLNPSCG